MWVYFCRLQIRVMLKRLKWFALFSCSPCWLSLWTLSLFSCGYLICTYFFSSTCFLCLTNLRIILFINAFPSWISAKKKKRENKAGFYCILYRNLEPDKDMKLSTLKDENFQWHPKRGIVTSQMPVLSQWFNWCPTHPLSSLYCLNGTTWALNQ